MSTFEPVVFRNRGGERLMGVLHSPAAPRTDVAVVLLSPGIKSRVGPHRLYVKLAHVLVNHGYTVLRFDFAGLGESEGRVDTERLPDLYRSIQLGRFVDDTLDAVAWMQQTQGVPRVVVGGLCGGVLTGLLAAPQCAAIAGVFGLGIPVVLDGTDVDHVANLSAGQLDNLRSKYLRKLTDPKSWARLLTFRTDLRMLWRAMGGRRQPAAGRDAHWQSHRGVIGGNGNPLFGDAFFTLLERRIPMLLVFGGADRLYWDYREKFGDPHAQTIAHHADVLDVRIVEQANHVLTFLPWQDEFFRACEDWFDRRFPDPVSSRARNEPVGAAR